MGNIHKSVEAIAIEVIERLGQERIDDKEMEWAISIFKSTRTLLSSYRKRAKEKGDMSPRATIIEQAIIAYKESCISSKKEDLIRRYNMMYHYFIAAEKKRYSDLAKDYYVNERTVRRDIKNAVCDMMIHFYGIDGLIALTYLTKQNN